MTTTSPISIRRATVVCADEIGQLAELLVGVVAAGASVGYLPPLDLKEAAGYRRGVPAPNVVPLLAETDGRIVGTAQIELATRINGRHRAEVNKVPVHPAFQRRGIGR